MNTLGTVRSGYVVIGVDTHKHVHVAAAMDTIGGILATLTITTDTDGFKQLLEWASSFGKVLAFRDRGHRILRRNADFLPSMPRPTRSSRRTAPTIARDEPMASPTPSTLRTPPDLCSPDSPLRHQRAPMVPSR